jgi:hypothetical protein
MFSDYIGKTFQNENTGKALNGEYLISDVILRFEDGLLSGGTDYGGEEQPAVVLTNGHTEWWNKGKPHRDEGPAIITKFGDWEEYWFQGKLVTIRAKGDIEINPKLSKESKP